MTRHFFVAITLTIGLFYVSALAEQSYPPPTAGYQAPMADAVRVAEMNGRAPEAKLENVTVFYKQEDLVVHPYFHFPGSDAAIVIDDAPALNPTEQLTLAVWFNPAEQVRFNPQKPLLLKSYSTHQEPFYQYGLFLFDPGAELKASFVLSLGGKPATFTTTNRALPIFDGWNHLAATFDGQRGVIFLNGNAFETRYMAATPTPIDRYPTPLVVGAFANQPRNEANSFAGQIGEFGIWDRALTDQEIAALVAEKRELYPLPEAINMEDSEYSRAVNRALTATEDIWANEVLATGDPSFDKVKDYLRPIFYSTGRTFRDYAPYNVVIGLEDGVRPLISAGADGSGVYVDRYLSDNAITFQVGANGEERFGETIARLGERHWEEGWLPVFHTSYTTAGGAKWQQELAALKPATPGDKLVALGRFELVDGASVGETLRIALPSNARARFRASAGSREGSTWVWKPTANEKVFFYAFALGDALPPNLTVNAESYQEAKNEWCGYWRQRVENDSTLFWVPEKLVMDCQRNRLYQNLVLRWRTSMGCAVYDNHFYAPESHDAMSQLAKFGYTAEARKGLSELIQWDKGPTYYLNLEKAEKLTHAVEYWHYTHDDDFIREHADTYRGYIRDFQQQMADDPHGLLTPQRFSGDIPQAAQYTFHLTTAWRGTRDMARLLGRLGYEQDATEFGAVAEKLYANTTKAIEASQRWLPDGTLFMPEHLFQQPETTVFSPVCSTVLGSYWNLTIPYALCTGFWQMDGEEMDAILGFMRNHGSFILGMQRFNYYPTNIGAYSPKGLAGYYTHGTDNLYLLSTLRVLAVRDETDHLLMSFYGYLAHGMTRGTFMSGEGDSIGVFPGHEYRSMYGSFLNSQNATFFQSLRALMIQETYNAKGEPSTLRLTPATPRVWLEDGKTISFQDAPTIFGPVSGKIVSHLNDNRVAAEWVLPSRNPPSVLHWRVRLPDEKKIASVKVDGKAHDRFDATTGVIDLTGIKGAVSVEVICR